MRNNTYLKLDSIYQKYKGYIGTRELIDETLSNRQIAALTEEGYLEKICHGYYWITGRCRKPTDYKCIEVCLSNPRAVICMGSAIYYQGGLEAEPDYLSVATERTDRSLLKMNFLIKRHYFSCNNFELGIRKRNTEFGYYNIYDVERSVCDMLRFEQKVETGLLENIKGNGQQYERMLKYAEQLKIRRTVGTIEGADI